MSNLTEQNIEFVTQIVNGSTIESSEMKEDLIDHFCCAIEEEMKKGLSFEKSYEKAYQDICPDGLDEIQRETVFLLTSTRKKALKLILYLSGYLSVIAVTSTIYLTSIHSEHIPGSSLLLAVSIILSMFIFLPSLFLNQYKRKISRSFIHKLIYNSGILGLSLLLISILFKIQHWAYGSYLLIASLALINFAFFPLLFFKMYKYKNNRTMGAVVAKRVFLILGIITFLSGVLLIISHIKYGGAIILIGIVLLGLRIIPPILGKILFSSNDNQSTNYPSISQSFGITGIVILGMLITFPVNLWLNDIIGKEASMLIYYCLAIGIPLGIVYSIRKGKTKLSSFNVSLENKRIIPYLIIGSVALGFGIASPIASSIPMPESIKKAFLEFGSQTGIYAFILMVIAAPVMEELICRGIILDGLLKIYSPLKSILVSSLLFGIIHLNPWQFVTALIIGIFSGWVYYKTRSLLPSIIIHASLNLSGFLMRYFVDMNSLMNDSLVKIYGGITNLILSIVGSIIILSICIYFLIKEFNKENLKLMTQRNIN